MSVQICYCLPPLFPRLRVKRRIGDQMPTVSRSSSRFHLICKRGTWQLFTVILFSREAADNKWSIFICNHRFPSSLINTVHIHPLSCFHISIRSSWNFISRSFVIISVDGGCSAPVCWSSTTSLTHIKSCLGSECCVHHLLWLLFGCFDRQYWWRDRGHAARLCPWCSTELSLISILVSIHNPACVSGDPMRSWSKMGTFSGRRKEEEGHCKKKKKSYFNKLFYHVSTAKVKVRSFIKQNTENNSPAGFTKKCTSPSTSSQFSLKTKNEIPKHTTLIF